MFEGISRPNLFFLYRYATIFATAEKSVNNIKGNAAKTSPFENFSTQTTYISKKIFGLMEKYKLKSKAIQILSNGAQ